MLEAGIEATAWARTSSLGLYVYVSRDKVIAIILDSLFFMSHPVTATPSVDY